MQSLHAKGNLCCLAGLRQVFSHLDTWLKLKNIIHFLTPILADMVSIFVRDVS